MVSYRGLPYAWIRIDVTGDGDAMSQTVKLDLAGGGAIKVEVSDA
ncbi:MAG: hypothetical protein WD005_01625 [Haliea sp.]